MDQRRLRLGDILDDYCPRERRVTNHLVVAMIDDEVKQTRCSTCDADHEYRQARIPAPRRKKDAGALAVDVADAPRPRRPDPVVEAEADDADADAAEESVTAESSAPDEAHEAGGFPESLEPADEALVMDPPREDDGPVHRRLIRATLPRPEGQVPERREPEFTVRQPGSGGRGGREVDGNRPSQGQGKRHHRPHRGGGNQPGDARFAGQGDGNRRGQPSSSFSNHRGGRPGGNDARPGGGEGRFRRRRGR
jgi:hypothetical protein